MSLAYLSIVPFEKTKFCDKCQCRIGFHLSKNGKWVACDANFHSAGMALRQPHFLRCSDVSGPIYVYIKTGGYNGYIGYTVSRTKPSEATPHFQITELRHRETMQRVLGVLDSDSRDCIRGSFEYEDIAKCLRDMNVGDDHGVYVRVGTEFGGYWQVLCSQTASALLRNGGHGGSQA